MSLTLYFHPFSSFCQKVLIALYENEISFTPHLVDLGDPTARAAFQKIWPLAKFPVLRDDANDRTVPETSVIIEYLDLHYPGRTRLIPADADLAWQCRLLDRFYDLYVNEPMGKVVSDRLRPADGHDPYGVEQARGILGTSYTIIEDEMRSKRWALGDAFSLADCAAAPALLYANKVVPFGHAYPNTTAYLSRLTERPSFARTLEEAKPYWATFPA